MTSFWNIALYFWLPVLVVLVLVFLLAHKFIDKYFEFRKGRYDPNKNYISRVAFGVLLTAFLVINPSITKYIIGLLVNLINQLGFFQLPVPEISLDFLDVVLYFILCLGVVTIIFLSYRHRYTTGGYDLLQDDEADLPEIPIPEDHQPDSPHLAVRVKELLEIKHSKHDLFLKYLAENDSVLYGSFEDDFNTFVVSVYCDDRKGVAVHADEVRKALEYMSSKVVSRVEQKKSPVIRFYYIVTDGRFESRLISLPIKCQTEDDFVKELIDFRKYLENTLIHDYLHRGLFSLHEGKEQARALSDNFIMPAYSVRKGESEPVRDLNGFIDEWLDEGADRKHLVLLGDYGMGKTSYLKYYAAYLAKRICEGESFARFPVLISLTNTSPRHGGITKCIRAFVAEHLV